MRRIFLALLALSFAQITHADTVIADASAFSAGTDVSNAYPGVVLSTAEASMIVNDLVVTVPLRLISGNTTAVYTTGTYFYHASWDLWSAGQCCGPDLALRMDFTRPTSSVAVLFVPDDTDTAVLQIYDSGDNLLAEVLDRKNTPMTLSLNSPSVPIAYALATFGDTGRIATLSYTQSATQVTVDIKPGKEPNSINLVSGQKIPVVIL